MEKAWNSTADSLYAEVTGTLRAAGCVFAEEEAQLLLPAAGSPTELANMVAERAAGMPLEYVLGWAEFCGRRMVVERGVFIPRRRTEFLASLAIGLARQSASPVVLDLCCGSGAIGAAMAAAVAGIQLHAADVDPAAVRCARRNIATSGRVYEGDLYEPLPVSLQGQVDVLIANAPYVPTGGIARLPQEARMHEARVALDGGADGLDIHRRVAAAAPGWLVLGGRLLVEVSEGQAAQTAAIFMREGLGAQVVSAEELDATVVIGTKL
ncbi:putative protein N(5)-glutamine methyltransferase [Paenibacillus aestuarii]|uniref:peptide chain release factor N(5)-glutamine methyltransferase n=1 Tax=Paenibacillus aestuarii TaxID=516965 RepID=A0ABW0K319_9BACL|nr:putative protein N(5)-glutamine methyltransferase [Paenibacillus aestuarii]